MYKWILGVCIVAIAGIVLYFAVAGGGGVESELRLANDGHVHTLDPGRMTWMQDIRISRALREGLTTYHPETLEPAPGVATSWTLSDDALTYTFTLREEARWSNGDPVVAGDFLYAWKRALHPALSADYTYLLWTIQNAKPYTQGLGAGGTPVDFETVGIKAIDDHTLAVTLEQPCGYFLDLTSFSTFEPVHPATCGKFRKPSGAWDPKWLEPDKLVCNGAYTLLEHAFQQRLVLKKNPHYWDAENVPTETLTFHQIEEPKRSFLMYERGELDAIFSVPLGEAQDLFASPARNGKDFFVFPAFGTYFYRFNTTRKPFDDRRVRRAFVMATDKRRITEVVTRLGERPSDHFVPVGTPNYTSPKGLEYDPAKARELLAEAGYPGGNGLPEIEILFNTREDHRRIARAIGTMWKENLGVTFKLSNQESKVFGESMRNLRYTVCRSGWFGDYGDANTFLDMFQTGNGNNETGYANPQYDRLIQAAATEVDPAERTKLFQKAEAMLLADAPIMPIYQYNNKFLIHRNVRGVGLNPRNIIIAKQLYRVR